MISSTSTEMPSLMVHTPSSLEVSPSQFSNHQEPEVSRAPTVAKIPITNSWAEINENTVHTDSEEDEIDVMEITPSNSTKSEPQITSTSSVDPQTEKAFDTESSSGCDQAESDLSDTEKSKIRKKWNKQKYNVAWRWSWLQLQSTELQHQLKQCDASVPPPQAISNNKTNNQNNDATTQPSTTSTSQSVPSSPTIPKSQKKKPEVQRHPLFSSKDHKKRIASPDLTSARHKRLKQYNDDSTRRSLSRSTNCLVTTMNSESPLTSPRLHKRNGSRSDKFNIDHIVLPCTSPTVTTPSTPKDVPTPKWRDFGNDPFEGLVRSQSMESTSPLMSPKFRRTKSTTDVHLERCLSVEFPKEDTQGLRKSTDSQQSTDINTEVKHETLDSLSPRSNQNGLKTTLSLSASTTFSLSQEGTEVEQKREFHLIRSESGSSLASQTGFKSDGSSSEEDTSDEAFMVRHFCRELLERRRLFKANDHEDGLNCPNDLEELPAVFWQSPEEYFRVKLRCRQSEVRAKLKDKFTRIRSRYVNPCTIMNDWEKQGVEAERIMAERAHELKQREALLASSTHREHREPRVRIIDEDDEEEEEEQNSYCASSEEEEDFFDQYSESSEGAGSHGQSDESEDMQELDEDSDGEYSKYRRKYDLTASTGRRKHKKRRKVVKPPPKGRRGRPKQLNQFSPEFGRWEIVRKTPPMDPITKQLRNIIYLRRVREHTQSAD